MPTLKVDGDALIKPTDVTYRWIFDSLNGKDKKWDALRKRHEISGVKVEVISGAGFLSYVFRVRIFFSLNEESFNTILKVPTCERLKSEMGIPEGDNDELIGHLIRFHNQEIAFYSKVAAQFKEVYFPKLYAYIESDPATSIHGRLLMEDVGHLGMLPNILEGLNISQCREAITTIAKFHGFSFCKLTTDWITQFTEKHRPGGKKGEDGESGDDDHEFQPHQALLQLDPFFESKQKEMKTLSKRFMETQNLHFKFGVPPFLVHGDYWGNNIFFARNEDGSCSNKLFTIFDWQCPKLGTGLGDVARIVATSASINVLQNGVDDLLQEYYSTLTECLAKRNRKVPYSYEKMVEMFRFEFSNEFLFSCMILPTLARNIDDENVKAQVRERLRHTFKYALECFGEPTADLDLQMDESLLCQSC